MNSNTRSKTLYLTQLAVLIAVVAVCQLFLGSIKVGPVTLTFVLLPIVVGAVTLGPLAGCILGLVFGGIVLTLGITGQDVFTFTLFQAHPVFTSLICLGKGAAAGAAAGWVYRLLIQKRSVATAMILSVATLGIYAIYWQYLLLKNIKALRQDQSGCTGEMLCLIFVPFYSFYWWYTRGCLVKKNFTDRSYTVFGDGKIYLLLGLLGLNIVSMAIMQNDFDSLPAEAQSMLKNAKNETFAAVVAAATAPIVNTGLFVLGGLTMVSDTLGGFTGGDSLLWFLVIVCAGVNFLVELGLNLVLSPVICRVLAAKKRLGN